MKLSITPRPEKCDCGHKWHKDKKCSWTGREEDMELECTCELSYATFDEHYFAALPEKTKIEEALKDSLDVMNGWLKYPPPGAEPSMFLRQTIAKTETAIAAIKREEA